jgi:hypothetical protein
MSDDQKARDNWHRYIYGRDNGHSEFVAKADKCESFFRGVQWSEDDMTMLRSVKRPALTINKILSTLSTVMGEQIENRVEVNYRPKSGSLQPTADALNMLWTHIAHENQLPWARSEMFADGLIRSRGFMDVRLDFDDNVFGEVRISNQNSKNVIVDPDAEDYDPDKWGDVILTKWHSPDEIAVAYDENIAKELKTRDGSQYSWGVDSIDDRRERFMGVGAHERTSDGDTDRAIARTVRVIDRQHYVLDKREHFVDPVSGDMRPIPESWDRNKIASVVEQFGYIVHKKLIKRVRWTVSADDLLLHDAWSPYKHFTVVPFFPYFRYGATIGMVENLLGPQELLNKVTSQELHVINTTANSGWKVKAGALLNMTVEELKSRGSETGLVLELTDPADAEKIQPNQIPSGLERLSYKAEEQIKTISSVSDSMQGFDREDVAAKAIAAKQQRGAVSLIKMFDNLQRSDYILARNVLDIVQEYYTEERQLKITKNPYTLESQEISLNRATPEGTIENDLTVGEYDIMITSVPHRATLEEGQFEQGMQLKELGIPIPDNVLIENSRLVRKAEILKQMEDQGQSEEAQKQAALQDRMLEAEVAVKEAEAQRASADAQLKMAKAQKEIAELEGGGGQGQQAAEAQQQIALDTQKMEAEFALKREQMEREFELKREQMDRDSALKREQASRDFTLKRATAEVDADLKRQQLEQQAAAQPANDQE